MDYLVMRLLRLVRVGWLESVGIIVVVGMVIRGGGTAYLVIEGVWMMIYLCGFFGGVSVVVGVGVSFRYKLWFGGWLLVVG
ncbi:metal ABC transporter permease, partial [Bacillus altitudinis]|uniref:metal ABC transporter permease n=1 Tax=Bacillus altitudinis TaxID=293387 RepID=UPI0016436E8D